MRTTLIILACCFAMGATGCGDRDKWPHGGTADYVDKEIGSADGSSFGSLMTGDYHHGNSPVAKIYIQIGTADAVYLPEIQSAQARKLFGEPVIDGAIDGTEISEFSLPGRSRVVFRGEKVAYCYATAKDNVAIGVSPAGPFYRLPITRDEMITVFGKPDGYSISEGKGWRP